VPFSTSAHICLRLLCEDAPSKKAWEGEELYAYQDRHAP
jgi:hypothetical protein